MHFSTKKMGVKFFHRKKTKLGGGPGGGLAKDHTFSGFFFVILPLIGFVGLPRYEDFFCDWCFWPLKVILFDISPRWYIHLQMIIRTVRCSIIHSRRDPSHLSTWRVPQCSIYLEMVFSCPKQLNRWPCHSLTHSLTPSLTPSLHYKLRGEIGKKKFFF